MALSDLLIKFNPARPAVDARGAFTKEVSDALAKLIRTFNDNVSQSNTDTMALSASQFIVSTSNTALTAERVTTDTATVSWDHSAAAQAKANVVDGSITTTKLGGDITTAGKALLDDANAAAQRTTLGLGTAATSNTGDFEAAGSIATHAAVTSSVHGITAFGASLVDDANASAARTTLGLGTLATLDAVTNAYTINNETTTRTLDADDADGAISATPTKTEVENIRDAVLVLADVVGTLIEDLKAKGIVG